MGATNQGYANVANNLLALGRLNEIHQAGVTQAALRREQQMATAEKVQTLQAKNREEELRRGTQAIFGTDMTPEAAGFIEEARALSQPGATTAEVLPTTTTSPGGFKIPNVVQATPSRQTIQGALGRSKEAARGESLANLQGVYGYGPETDVYKRMQTQTRAALPSSVAGTVKEYEESIGRRKKIEETEEDITGKKFRRGQEEALAPDVRTIKGEEAKQAKLKTAADELTALHAPRLKQLEVNIKTSEDALKQADVANIGVNRAQLHENLAKTRQDLAKARFELKRDIGIQTAIDKAMALPEGSPQRLEAYKGVLALKGEPTWMLNQPAAMHTIHMQGTQQALAGYAKADELMAAGDVAGAQRYTAGANDWAVRTAQMSNAPTVEISSLTPEAPSILPWAKQGYERKVTRLGTQHASLYTQGLTQEAAKGVKQVPNPFATGQIDPVTGQSDKFIPPDYALYYKIKIEHGADQPLDYYAKIVEKEVATPATKEGALQRFQKADPTIQAAKTPAQETAKPKAPSQASLPVKPRGFGVGPPPEAVEAAPPDLSWLRERMGTEETIAPGAEDVRRRMEERRRKQ